MHADGDGALTAPEGARAVCLFCLGVTATHAAATLLAPGLRVEAVGVASIEPSPLPPLHDIDHHPRIA
jgi:hypothetical protein